MLCQTGTSISSSSRLLVYLCLLFGRSRSPTRNPSYQHFRVLHWTVQILSFQYVPSTPRISLKCSPRSPHFLPLTSPFLLFFLLLLSRTRRICVQTVYLFGLLLTPSIFSRLRCPIFFQLALLSFSLIQPYQLWLATSFLAYSSLYIDISTFSRLSFVHSQFCS